jgi:hypothetical protein
MKSYLSKNGDGWINNNFSNLFGHITKNREHDNLQNLESVMKDYHNPLDSQMTLNELQDKIQTLQPKKSCWVDALLIEMMIKYTDPNSNWLYLNYSTLSLALVSSPIFGTTV